jgi:hypothetical protein
MFQLDLYVDSLDTDAPVNPLTHTDAFRYALFTNCVTWTYRDFELRLHV